MIDIYLNIRAEKAQKQLMPLAFRQWHQLFFMEHRNTIDAEVATLIALTLIRMLQDNMFVII